MQSFTDESQEEIHVLLNEDYLRKILNIYTKNQLHEIKNFKIEPATTKGENYASLMQLVTIKFTRTDTTTTEELSLIVKSRLENELMSAIEESFDVFQRESQVYTVIHKQMSDLLETIGDNTIFGPKVIYIDEKVIVQENLKLRGYKILDVKLGLNFEQCRIVLEKLAKFHATSMVLYKKNPDIFRHHLPGNISENATPLHDVYINTINSTIKFCESDPDLKKYVRQLENFATKIVPKMINVFSRNLNDRFHSLNHGDLWVNNIMFHVQSNGIADDILFVDYQEGFYGSPGIDLNYFMFSSMHPEVFTNSREALLIIYQTTLCDMLHKLEYCQRIPTIEDIQREIINKAYHGLTTAACLLPALINEHQDLADPLNFLLNTDEAIANRETIFNNQKFAKRLKVFLPFFEEHGLL